jgi:phenylpropionate dioxygenase-like ring-hydroxylating dioxygenase large terminal subunit
MVRTTDGSIRVLMNRCAHKGTKVVSDFSGNAGKTFRCPYHAWTYRLDGSLLNIPLKDGYAGTRLQPEGLPVVKNVETYRGFVFARLAEEGIGFRDYFGESLSSIDFLADRSPEGELEITGGCLRYLHNCNW